MSIVILNDYLAKKVLKNWRTGSSRRYEEVWDGVTYIMPEADIEHDDIAGFFYRVFFALFADAGLGRVHFRINVSDRDADWTDNYRVPDMTLYLADNPARARGTHYIGGPDFALEVGSPGDRSRDKLDFYARIGTREVMIIDRDPWRIELFQLRRGKLRSQGAVRLGDTKSLKSDITSLSFRLGRSRPRPKVKIVHTETGQEWVG